MKARECLVANIAVFRSLRKLLNVRRLCSFWAKVVILLDAICGILPRNMRHIGVQYASYYPAICVISGTNMPSMTSKEMAFAAPKHLFRLQKVSFRDFSSCRMPKKVDDVLSKYFTLFFFFRGLLLISYLSFHELENWRIILQSHSRQSRRLRQTIPKTHF